MEVKIYFLTLHDIPVQEKKIVPKWLLMLFSVCSPFNFQLFCWYIIRPKITEKKEKWAQEFIMLLKNKEEFYKHILDYHA
jgi:hypothetical protein